MNTTQKQLFSFLFFFAFACFANFQVAQATHDLAFDICLSPLVSASLGLNFAPSAGSLVLGQANLTARDLLDICLDVDVDLDLDLSAKLGISLGVDIPSANKFIPKCVTANAAGTNVYVSETTANRILRFAVDIDVAANVALPDANLVIGQTGLEAKVAATTQVGLSAPVGLVVGNGKLFVCDSQNHRVLRYDNIDSVTVHGPKAVQVIGQASFSAKVSGLAKAKLNLPTGLCYDDVEDILWIVDSGNNRILRFNHISAKALLSAQADAVLGAPDFVTLGLGVDAAITATNIFGARDCVFDATRNVLYVVSDTLHRVLRFDNARTHANFAVAAAVFGQIDLTSVQVTAGVAAKNLLFQPFGVSLDINADILFVADKGNNRVVAFNAASKVSVTAGDAFTVLGQLTLQANLPNAGTLLKPSKLSLYAPTGLWFNALTGNLWVADFLNARLVAFPGCKTPASCTCRSTSRSRSRSLRTSSSRSKA